MAVPFDFAPCALLSANQSSIAPPSPNIWVNLSHVLERPKLCGLAEQGYIKGSRLFQQVACPPVLAKVSCNGPFHAETATRQHDMTEMNLTISNKSTSLTTLWNWQPILLSDTSHILGYIKQDREDMGYVYPSDYRKHWSVVAPWSGCEACRLGPKPRPLDMARHVIGWHVGRLPW